MKNPVYVVDTNVFLTTTDALALLGDKDVVIPFKVLEELDNIKMRKDRSVAYDARRAVRKIENLRKSGNLMSGVMLPDGGRISVASPVASSFGHLDLTCPDNHVIATAIGEKFHTGRPVIVVTNDICLRLKCAAHGIDSEPLEAKEMQVSEDFYSGMAVVDVSQMDVDAIYRGEEVVLDQTDDLFPNQFLHLRCIENPKSGALVRFTGHDEPLRKVSNSHPGLDKYGFQPRNREQTMALDLLMDPDVPVVTIVGFAGTGKTLAAVAAGLAQLTDRGDGRRKSFILGDGPYERLILSRPIQAMGQDIGFLPGSKEEKMAPWVQPIIDNVEVLLHDAMLFQDLTERGIVQIEAPTYIRGRSINNSFMLIDEAQNLSPHEIKTIVTRVGEGTKIVFTGDVEQIDRAGFTATSNGLAYLIENFKHTDLAGHITLKKGERSAVAEYAAKVLK